MVGINGCGKSTLLRMLGRELEPEAGEVRWGRGARIGFLTQQPVLPTGTVAEAVGAGWEGEAMLDRLGMAALVAIRNRMDAMLSQRAPWYSEVATQVVDTDRLTPTEVAAAVLENQGGH